MNEHLNHRDRLKERFLTQGLDGFDDHQILELLLFYSIPRIDTNPIAHRLLNKFGSLNGVLTAPRDELVKIEGVGDNTATFLKFLMSFNRKLGLENYSEKERFNTLQKVGDYLISLYRNETTEKAYLLCFNGKMELTDCILLSSGTTSATSIPSRSLVESAILSKANAVILAHNHPTGYCTPSESDVHMTNQLRFLLDTLQIKLLEHIIVSENKFYPIICSSKKTPIESFNFTID